MTATMAIAGAGAVWLLARLTRAPGSVHSSDWERVHESQPLAPLLGYLLILALGASAIYAMAGGYSYDARKRYPLLPLMLWVVGLVLNHIRSRGKVETPLPRGKHWGIILVTALCAIGIPSTWLYVNVWRHECRRQTDMVEYCLQKGITGPVRVEWVPDIYRAWPQAKFDWGFRLDEQYVVDAAFDGARHDQRITVSDSAPLVLRSDPNGKGWRSAVVK